MVHEPPEDVTVVPKYVEVIEDSTIVYAVCAFGWIVTVNVQLVGQ